MMRLWSRCPSPRALSRAFSLEPENRRLRDHVRSCAACGAAWAQLERLRDLTRGLPAEPPRPDELEGVRSALLAASLPVSRRTRPRPLLWAGAALAAAAVLFAAGLLPRGNRSVPEPPRSSPLPSPLPSHLPSPLPSSPATAAKLWRGVVHAIGDAVYELATAQPDERVRLHDGEISVDVAPLLGPERFRVITGDAEVEVKGTSFVVVAHADRLVNVRVTHGRVVVRARASEPVVVGPSEEWHATHAAALRPRSRASSIDHRLALRHGEGPPASVPPVDQPVKVTSNPAELAFADGWQALRAHRLADAATAFKHATSVAGDQPLAEDAWFWMAVCQARIPRPTEASASLAAFIDRFPRSSRVGEVSAMLGWILIEQGDLRGAARRFAAAVHDPAAEVRASAAQGLRIVESQDGPGTR